MSAISPILIIHNPNSTGDGKKNARECKQELTDLGVSAQLVATKHAGHAKQLAKTFAKEHAHGMVISSSGDGGYHEVVNGAVESGSKTIVTGLLPSGNANDHYRAVHKGNAARRIAKNDIRAIDLIKVETPSWTHYAHSYVGLGITPQIGKQLTEQRPNQLQEKWLVFTHLFKTRPVKIRVNGKKRTYSHMIFSNVKSMSKVLTLSNEAKMDDGLFEVTKVSGDSLWTLFAHLFGSAAQQIDEPPQAKTYEFTARRNLTIQLDGEIYPLKRNQTVKITCEKQRLRTIV